MAEKPTVPDGPPDGPPAAAAPDVGPPRAAVAAFLAGEPGTLPPQWCKVCKADVTPVGKGKCPRCNTFLKLNFVARRHPVNKLRKDQIRDQLVADYAPSTTLLRAACEQLAGILEQLEVMRPGSPDHQRLVQLSQSIGALLEESRAARGPSSTDVGALTTPELIERSSTVLRALLEVHEVEIRNAEMSPMPCPPDGVDGGAPVAPPTGAAAASAPALELVCEYCQRRCVGPEHFAYDVLHWRDPVEVKKRDAHATAVMMKMMPYGNPY